MTDLRRRFEERGYIVLQGLLSPEEAARYRSEIQRLSGLGDDDFGKKRFECPDGVSKNRQFWPLINHPRLIPTIRELLGPSARYTQHSDLHAHRGGVGWHRDSACRTFGVGADWDESEEPYQVARVAIYLQSYAESRSSLGVLPGSHVWEEPITGIEARLWRRVIALREAFISKWGLYTRGENLPHQMRLHSFPSLLLRTCPRLGSLPWPFPAVPVWIKTEPGDCVIFNQRLYHSATPLVGPKYAIFLSYATENSHGRNHIAYYRNIRKDLQYGPLDPELAEVLKSEDLFLEPAELTQMQGATVYSS
jgi:Phytanoyl-CoA dioxygenase (PhyH)